MNKACTKYKVKIVHLFVKKSHSQDYTVSQVDENKHDRSKTDKDEDPSGNNEPEKILVAGENRTVTPTDRSKGPTKAPPFKFVSREEWGAELPTKFNPFRGPARSVRLIFTDSKSCRSKKTCMKVIKKLQRLQIRQGLSDIAYK